MGAPRAPCAAPPVAERGRRRGAGGPGGLCGKKNTDWKAYAGKSGFEEARQEVHDYIRAAGFNYTGSLSVGNVVDLSGLGVAMQKCQ